MPKPAWEDLDAFLDPGDFATACVVHFQAGGTRPVTGLFDDPYLDAQVGEFVMDSSQPRLLAKASDLTGIKRGDWIVVPGEGTFDIMTSPQGDGNGMSMLKLEKQ